MYVSTLTNNGYKKKIYYYFTFWTFRWKNSKYFPKAYVKLSYNVLTIMQINQALNCCTSSDLF